MENLDIKFIIELAETVRENNLTKLEVFNNELHIFIERENSPEICHEPIIKTEQTKTELVNLENIFIQKSPIVGTVFLTPEAGSPPFVSVGAKVSQGDVLCLIEAMKLYNELRAESDGVILEICVSNGASVEYGQPLFKIK